MRVRIPAPVRRLNAAQAGGANGMFVKGTVLRCVGQVARVAVSRRGRLGRIQRRYSRDYGVAALHHAIGRPMSRDVFVGRAQRRTSSQAFSHVAWLRRSGYGLTVN